MGLNVFNTDFILQEKRYSWIDYDKGISIILVAYGHCLTLLANGGVDFSEAPGFTYAGMFLYGFRMPLFFIISGVFLTGSLSRKGLGGYIYGRTNNILYPLLIWGLLEITLQLTAFYLKTRTIDARLYLSLLIHPREIGTGHLWYLNALFSIGVVYACLREKLRMGPIPQLVLGLVLYSISAYIHIHNIEGGMLTDLFAFYIWFSLGVFISSIVLDERNVRRFASLKIFFPLATIFIIIQYYCTSLNLTVGQGHYDYVEHKLPFLFLAEALVGCILSVNISFQLQKHKLLRFLRVVGFHSLFIYCMQIMVMLATTAVMIKVLNVTNIPVLVIVVWMSGVLPPMFLYNFCLRHNLWRLFTFIKPEKEIASLKGENKNSFPIPAN
ncbi:MAG: acyltransferase [Puia sp.]|nr:acyltransferase [Puia sp.]